MDLKLEDLFSKCETCNGTGTYNPKDDESGLNIVRSNNTCTACDGKCIKLTEIGKVIKDFIKKLKEKDLI